VRERSCVPPARTKTAPHTSVIGCAIQAEAKIFKPAKGRGILNQLRERVVLICKRKRVCRTVS
jgi:hypothetical protein